jgi:hypothetical protein
MFELVVVTEGVLSCDGERCDDECPIHGTTSEEINE